MPKSTNISNHYFTILHENAILEYVKTDDIKKRTKLYVEFLQPAFSELVSKIVFTYKFSSLPNINSLKEECEVWLITILEKFDVTKNHKAFSYFSIIVKNWFIAQTKKCANQNKKEVQCDSGTKDLSLDVNMVSLHLYVSRREEQEFWDSLIYEMDFWMESCVKEHEVKVLQAIKILMENIDDIDIFNKKAMYLFLREITNLSTKQIVACLNKFRNQYKSFRRRWNAGAI